MSSRQLTLPLLLAIACGAPATAPVSGPPRAARGRELAFAPVQTCTATTLRGTPVKGLLCGGSTHAQNCTAGWVYSCNDNTPTNNCTLSKACTIGCQTDPVGNPSRDSCFTGAAPLALSAAAVPGGSNVSATVTLADAHPQGAIVNMFVDRGDLVAARFSCNVPPLPAGVTSASFDMPTAVVGAQTPVRLFTDLAYSDSSGRSRQLVSVTSSLTLNPGGTAPPTPPVVSFTLSPSTIGPGGFSFMDATLQALAPITGVTVNVTSSDPTVASVIAAGQPNILGGCTTGGGAATLQAASNVAQQTTISVSASSTPDQVPVTNPLTVTPGCAPKTCLDLAPPACSGPDGCGGTLACGCPGGQTCGGGGTPGVCGTAASAGVTSLALNPSSVTGGASSTGTVTLSQAAPAGGLGVFLSSSNAAATVPSSIVIPQGQTSGTFAVATSAVQATSSATITASSNGTATAVLTLTAGTACTPTTCAAQGKNCGTIADGCGGTLSCGACTAPQTCGGGGAANVCGGGASGNATLTVSASGRSGVTVTSQPAGINVPVGQTGTASFPAGTAITLLLTDRTAIWSGACSSGTKDTSSCSFTLAGNSTVSANVQ